MKRRKKKAIPKKKMTGERVTLYLSSEAVQVIDSLKCPKSPFVSAAIKSLTKSKIKQIQSNL